MNGDLPQLLAVNESLLTRAVEEPKLSGFDLISRRDRSDESGWGGVALFALSKVAPYICLLEHAVNYEASWHTIHSDLGAILFCVWYRPPAPGELESVRAFIDDWERLAGQYIGTIVVGDLNVHHKRWLKHSSHCSLEGSLLYKFCCDNGFKQMVRSPTRDDHLLDLVLTDMGEAIDATVLPKIADHNVVRARFALQVSEAAPYSREVFLYKSANWTGMRAELRLQDWTWLDLVDVDSGCDSLIRVLEAIVRKYVPTTMLQGKSSSHPWLNQKCKDAIQAKRDAEGSDCFESAAQLCSDTLFTEFFAYNRRLRTKLGGLKRGSKSWWRISKQLADRKATTSGIPALKRTNGEWALESVEKANLLADTFAAKSVLPPLQANEYTFSAMPRISNGFLAVRARQVEPVLKRLDVESANGPDAVSARVLKQCACELAVPLSKLARRILSQNRWPRAWVLHWIIGLYKRQSVFDPDHYRGIHLTSQMSKVMERVLSAFFVPRLERHAFGTNQFAYRKEHGARDAVAFYVLSWIFELNLGNKVAIYCSDVSGAFDRVSTSILLRKLAACGLHGDILGVLRSWLRDRPAFVVVAGAKSEEMRLSNMVFQGTVWGSSLWNAFFGDAACVLERCGFTIVLYADDYNAFKSFSGKISNAMILRGLNEAQSELHRWGHGSQVIFDAGKEHFAILSTTDSHGELFRLLGVRFDSKLQMGQAVRDCVIDASWRMRTMMRTRRVHSTCELALLFKSHILSFLEYRTPAIYHACTSVLDPLDRILKSFLRDVCVPELDALMTLNLAPLSARRDIAMLGLVHRAVLGIGPLHFSKWFVRESEQVLRRSARQTRNTVRPLKPLQPGRELCAFRRSAFGLITVYNLLPNEIVSHGSVKAFQRALSDLLKREAATGNPNWPFLFSSRYLTYQHPLRDL